MAILLFFLEIISARAFPQNLKFWCIIRVGVNKALSFLSTFILYILFIVLLFYDEQMRPRAKNCGKASLFFSFKSLKLLRNIQWLSKRRANRHQHVP